MLLLKSPGTPRIERHCWKLHRDSTSQKRRLSKFAHFSPTPCYFLRFVAALEIAGVFSVLAWLRFEEAEKVRRSHVANTVASYKKFRDGLISLFGRFELEGAYCATLRGLCQSGSESMAAYAARTTNLCSHAYAEFSTKAQLSLAVDHFIYGLAD